MGVCGGGVGGWGGGGGGEGWGGGGGLAGRVVEECYKSLSNVNMLSSGGQFTEDWKREEKE